MKRKRGNKGSITHSSANTQILEFPIKGQSELVKFGFYIVTDTGDTVIARNNNHETIIMLWSRRIFIHAVGVSRTNEFNSYDDLIKSLKER